MLVGILDYGFGNVNSVYNAIKKITSNVTIISNSKDVKTAEILILPGVGSFDNAVSEIKTQNLWSSLVHRVNEKKPIIGICLGAQLLCRSSEEGILEGLGVFDIMVKRFSNHLSTPNMGWRTVLSSNLADLGMFYFTHSYHFDVNSKKEIIFATSKHGVIFPAVISDGFFWAIQFHPEKSQLNGIKFLEYVLSEITSLSGNVTI